MTREILIAAAKTACRQNGFDFCTGFEYRLASEVERLPAAWLEPPILKKTEGRNEGVKHYAIKITLLRRCEAHSPDSKEAQWAELELCADRIVKEIGSTPAIRMLAEIEYTPAEFTLTAAGELSLTISCIAQVPFGND